MPFLRLIFPCVSGIVVSYYINVPFLYLTTFIVGLVAFISFYVLKRPFAYRHLPGIGINCLLFTFFYMLTLSSLEKTEWNYHPKVCHYMIKILEDPVSKARSNRCSVQIYSVETEKGEEKVDKKAILYLAKDSLSDKLVAGNYLRVKILFKKQEPSPTQSPQYANYQKIKGYACIGYASSTDWESIHPPKSYIPDIQSKALYFRRNLIQTLAQIIPNKRQLSIASGILFGDKSTMDNDLKTAFSTTGGAHVLAVGGLHAGILYGVLLFPFGFFRNSKRNKCLQQLFILPLMWTFTFITGLTPSVVRTTIMLSFYGLAEITGKKSFSLNIVFAAAFFMLLYNPMYLFDIGFQFSFSAVIAIISINPLLINFYYTDNYILRYIWSLITVSISAQIGTMPLTIYYFNQFPVVFLLTNLFIIPLVGILLTLLLIYLIFSQIVALPGFMLFPLQTLLQLFISGIELITKIPYICISNLQLDISGAISLYLACFWLIKLFIHKKILFVYLLFLLGLFQVIHYL